MLPQLPAWIERSEAKKNLLFFQDFVNTKTTRKSLAGVYGSWSRGSELSSFRPSDRARVSTAWPFPPLETASNLLGFRDSVNTKTTRKSLAGAEVGGPETVGKSRVARSRDIEYISSAALRRRDGHARRPSNLVARDQFELTTSKTKSQVFIDNKVTVIPGVGPKLGKAYSKLGIETVRDMLLTFPFRYEDYRQSSGISDVVIGEATTIQGVVTSVRSRRSPRKKMVLTEATIEDGTGSITAVWFHQPYIAKTLNTGDRVSLSGKIDDKYGLSIVNPQFEKMKVGREMKHTGRLVPIYSLSGKMAQKGRRNAVSHALKCVDQIEEWMPEDVLESMHLVSIDRAVPELHFPQESEAWDAAMRRMKFGELLLHQLVHVGAKKTIEVAEGHVIEFEAKRTADLASTLPYELTDAQRKAAYVALKDMETGKPMHRLLEGDVGSGKTVVAALVADHVVGARKQVAYLAPTEMLAMQQATGLMEVLGKRASIALLTNSMQELNGEEVPRKRVVDGLLDGAIDIVVGTHALLVSDVSIPDLALVVVDEQHRFGVEQRKTLLSEDRRGLTPHFLSMTATPIPRTLAMALYGDMDISVLDELPAGRGSVDTVLLRPGQDKGAYSMIADRLSNGSQAYVVCPFIEASDSSEAESVNELAEKLRKGPLSKYTIEAVHGKLKPKDKARVMEGFYSGKIDILVATTVIEVGINVPNATTILIEGAERFGLAQLHQLRGRVRRSSENAMCFLHPTGLSGNTRQRMDAMVQHDDGFKLAEIDLELRGAGDRFGTRQSGLPEFEFASLSDHALIAQASEIANRILMEDPDLAKHELLSRELERFVGRGLD